MKKLLLPLLLLAFIASCSKTSVDIASTLLEYQITGTSASITIVTTNETGKVDSLKNQVLPYTLKYQTFSGKKSSVRVINNKVTGSVRLTLLVKGSLKKEVTITDPRATAIIDYTIATDEALTSSIIPEEWTCSTYNGRVLTTGSKGGCYYINSNANKTYVDRSYCNCD